MKTLKGEILSGSDVGEVAVHSHSAAIHEYIQFLFPSCLRLVPFSITVR